MDTSGDISSGSHSVGKTVSERDYQLSSPEISNSPLRLRKNSKIVPFKYSFLLNQCHIYIVVALTFGFACLCRMAGWASRRCFWKKSWQQLTSIMATFIRHLKASLSVKKEQKHIQSERIQCCDARTWAFTLM